MEGSRIRRIRLQKGLRQSAVAKACDISPSYLNLIEHNRRPAAGALLSRIAAALDVTPADLSGSTEATLVRRLDAVGGTHADAEPSEAFATRFPGWSRVVVDQAERLAELERTVALLNDRLTHDPYLSASLHNVLSTVTSIRSTSSILTSGDTIEPEWQARFHRNIHEDAQRLADAAGGLASYLEAETNDNADPGALPIDEVSSWLAARDWQVPDTTDAADFHSLAARDMAMRLVQRASEDKEALPDSILADHLSLTSDPLAIAAATGAAPDVAMRRLAALPDEAFASAVSPGLVACDASGTLTFRKPTRGFEPPRYGAACAVWPLFEALHRPGVPISRRVCIRGRDEVGFTATAFGRLDYSAGYDRPPVAEATMLMVPEMDRGGPGIGMSCRVCPEEACAARREASILHGHETASF